MSDEIHLEPYDQCEEQVNQVIERCETFLAAEEASDLTNAVIRKYEELNDLGKTISGELEALEKSLEELKEELKEKSTDKFRADTAQVAIAVASAEKSLDRAREMSDFILTNESDPNERKQLLKRMAELTLKTKTSCLRIKSFCHRTRESRPTSGTNSRAGSPDRCVDPGGGTFDFLADNSAEPNNGRVGITIAGLGMQSGGGGVGMNPQRDLLSDPGAVLGDGVDYRSRSHLSGSRASNPQQQSMFKSKRMDFPKFSGSIRSFNTFRRDFNEIVAADQAYSKEQMSHILRHECLQGNAKTLVHNIYDYNNIWDKLNDVYDNEAEVVQIITKQILQYKQISDEDWDGFVDFVNLIERAHYDLNALTNSQALSNPMTVATVLEKCPEWVQKELVKDLSAAKIQSADEFEFYRKKLVELRKQVRRLGNLRKVRSRAQGGRGLVNAIDSYTASKSGLTSRSEVVNEVAGGLSSWMAADWDPGGGMMPMDGLQEDPEAAVWQTGEI